jgi:hypothetical protein
MIRAQTRILAEAVIVEGADRAERDQEARLHYACSPASSSSLLAATRASRA